MEYRIDKKVVKFGGTSLASDEQIKKCAAIIAADPARRYVIPSAPGKRFPADEKVTDLLLKCHALASAGGDFAPTFESIKERYDSIIKGLGLSLDLSGEYAGIESRLSGGASRDYMASRGEYLNGLILAEYIGCAFIDASEVIFFKENGVFDSERTNTVLAERLSSVERAVIPGFYGSLPDGSIKTFSRGGSDVTGAIVARAALADIYENWTDVSGFLMADPRIVDNPKPIKIITYRELRELSYMGAGVLHEDSIFPVKLAGIPINIKNTNAPDDPGTMIVASAEEYKDGGTVTGIAGKKGFAVIRIEKDMMNQEKGFGMRVLKVFSDLGMSFEHLPSGIDTMCVVINENEIKGREREILEHVSREVNPDNIDIETGLGLIAIVGRGMINTPGTAYRVFRAVAGESVNVRMIDQGSSELNIILGVTGDEFDRSIRAIYNEFCG